DTMSDIFGVDAAKAAEQDNSALLAPYNSASQCGTPITPHIPELLHERSPPNFDRETKRLRTDTGDMNAMDAYLGDLGGMDLEGMGLGGMGGGPGSSLPGTRTTAESTESMPIPPPSAPAPTVPTPEDDRFTIPSEPIQSTRVGKMSQRETWEFWMLYRLVRHLEPQQLEAAARASTEGERIRKKLVNSALSDKRTHSAILPKLKLICTCFHAILRFQNYLKQRGLGFEPNYNSTAPTTDDLAQIDMWMMSAQVTFPFTAREYHAWMFGASPSMFDLVYDQIYGPTATPSDPPNPQVGGSTLPAYLGNLGHRKARPVIDDDGESDRNPTEASSAIASNPRSSVSYPLVTSGTPPTSARRTTTRKSNKSRSNLANSTIMEADQDAVTDTLNTIRNQITALQNSLQVTEQQRTQVVETNAWITQLNDARERAKTDIYRHLANENETRAKATELALATLNCLNISPEMKMKQEAILYANYQLHIPLGVVDELSDEIALWNLANLEAYRGGKGVDTARRPRTIRITDYASPNLAPPPAQDAGSSSHASHTM
ncbi:hypothetical protein FRC11_013702, partial [Ceratobasidium sp. 423]